MTHLLRTLHQWRRRIEYWRSEVRRWFIYRAKRHRFGGYDIEVQFHHPRQRLDNYLKHLFRHLDMGQIRRPIQDGRVLIDLKRVEPERKIRLHDRIQVLDPVFGKLRITPQDLPMEILHKDEHLVVVNKPARILTHPNLDLDSRSVLASLAGMGLLYQDDSLFSFQTGVVHRLDHPTSGCLCVARTRRGMMSMRRLFRIRKVKKEYRTLCVGVLQGAGTIDQPIGRDPKVSKRRAIDRERGKHAITHYRTVENGENWSEVSVTIETGRTHQIRVHLTSIGHPIVGDQLYGSHMKGFRLMLHAYRLSFIHPVTRQPVDIEAPVPQEFEEYKKGPGHLDASGVPRMKTP